MQPITEQLAALYREWRNVTELPADENPVRAFVLAAETAAYDVERHG